MDSLGLPLNPKKVVGTCDSMGKMGIQVDIINKSLSIPEAKLQDILSVCTQFQYKNICRRRELQSLLGKLLHISRIVLPARAFLNRMLVTLRESKESKTIWLKEQFHSDLQWFITSLHRFNGTTSFDYWFRTQETEMSVDASLKGLGAVFGDYYYYYSSSLPPFIQMHEKIVLFEMWNILIALRTWEHLHKGRRTRIWCDNSTVVAILNGNKTRDGILGVILLRCCLMLQAENNIAIEVEHVPGDLKNRADAVSRIHMDKCYDCIEPHGE